MWGEGSAKKLCSEKEEASKKTKENRMPSQRDEQWTEEEGQKALGLRTPVLGFDDEGRIHISFFLQLGGSWVCSRGWGGMGFGVRYLALFRASCALSRSLT